MADTERRCRRSVEEVDLPKWVIRRWVVVKDGKVSRFETLPKAARHRQEHGGEVRELEFRLAGVRTIPQGYQPNQGWIRADGE